MRTGAGFCITVALLVGPVVYPLSFRPACRRASHTRIGREMVAFWTTPVLVAEPVGYPLS